MLIIDVHGKWTAGSASLASDARFSYSPVHRRCKGAPATPFPLLQLLASTTTSPINCSAPVEYWQTKPKLLVVRLSIGIALVVLKSALRQSQYKLLRHFLALRYDQFKTAILDLPVSAMRGACVSFYFERGAHPEQRPRSRGGWGGPIAPKQARGRPKRPPGGGRKKTPPPALLPQQMQMGDHP
jgi:hypothetical protein